jgi:hypothetical protein
MHVLEFIDLMTGHGADPLHLAHMLDQAFQGYSKPDTKTLTAKELLSYQSIASAVESYGKSIKIPKEHLNGVQVAVYNPLHMRRYAPGYSSIWKDPPLFVKRTPPTTTAL